MFHDHVSLIVVIIIIHILHALFLINVGRGHIPAPILIPFVSSTRIDAFINARRLRVLLICPFKDRRIWTNLVETSVGRPLLRLLTLACMRLHYKVTDQSVTMRCTKLPNSFTENFAKVRFRGHVSLKTLPTPIQDITNKKTLLFCLTHLYNYKIYIIILLSS